MKEFDNKLESLKTLLGPEIKQNWFLGAEISFDIKNTFDLSIDH